MILHLRHLSHLSSCKLTGVQTDTLMKHLQQHIGRGVFPSRQSLRSLCEGHSDVCTGSIQHSYTDGDQRKNRLNALHAYYIQLSDTDTEKSTRVVQYAVGELAALGTWYDLFSGARGITL